MKILIAAIGSVCALGVQSVGGDVSCFTNPVNSPSHTTIQTIHSTSIVPKCGCGSVIVIINKSHSVVQIHNNVHINIHKNVHNNIHNNVHNKNNA